jgi:hypothetical protein
MRIGEGVDDVSLNNTIVAVVQPTEPKTQRSHVRDMLGDHSAAAHWQHIALRTPDLLAFHEHAVRHGVNFITPILKDAEENLIQVFSGEWFFPGSKPSGMFFEFLQRNPTEESVRRIQAQNNSLWFRDQTFIGLYDEKEREYQSGKVTPFLDFELFEQLHGEFGQKQVWQITPADLERADHMMLDYAARKSRRS